MLYLNNMEKFAADFGCFVTDIFFISLSFFVVKVSQAAAAALQLLLSEISRVLFSSSSSAAAAEAAGCEHSRFLELHFVPCLV